MGDFNRCIDVILAEEGGYVNHPTDPGGETNFGISKRAYPHLNIAALTQADALAIYQIDYPVTAIKLLQRTLKLTEDGCIGPLTITTACKVLPHLLGHYCTEHALRYASNPNITTFGRGWYRRLFRCHAHARSLTP